MAAVPSVNIVIPQGTTFSELFTSTESDGSATNLAGYSGTSKIRKYPGAATATSFSVSITGATGEVTISMASSITQTLILLRCLFDIIK
jgi:hypothetical protein